MNITDIILKKRNNGILNADEIDYFIGGYVAGLIPDYQMSALLMALWFRGMNKQETTDLTLAMTGSGDQIDLSAIKGVKVDKHSTGGVADTTTLVVAPLVAACGVKVAKMSGRGLGHTGGTLDKLESIPNLSISQSMDSFIKIVSECGLSVIGQTQNLVPADKMLYALRDVTCTVDNISLIASSIMSKKIASGANAIVLDVKTGNGAFMQDLEAAKDLAKTMVDIGTLAKRKTVALITDMNQPLGLAVGNALEVQEAIEILQGQHPGDLKTVSFALAAQMLIVADICANEEEAQNLVNKALESGEALKCFAKMIEAQGGNPDVVHDTKLLPKAKTQLSVQARQSGYITSIATAEIGIAALLLGAGRLTKEDAIDPAVGIWLKKRLNDKVEKGDELAVFHINDDAKATEAIERFQNALHITNKKPENTTLIYSKIQSQSEDN